MKIGLSKKIKLLFVTAVLVFCSIFIFACNDKSNNPYAKDNNFVVRTVDADDALEFCPVGITPTYGVVFYVGALIAPEHYTYLGEALAKQGYLVVIPKLANNMAFNDYKPNESTFVKYPNIKFFVGGHDMGGGSAVHRAMDYGTYLKGVLLFAPTAFQKQSYNADGSFVLDDDGNPVWRHFTISDKSIPTLLLETDDLLRTDELKQAVISHININSTTEHTLQDSTSAGFCTNTATDSNEAQRTATVKYTLDFLKSLVA